MECLHSQTCPMNLKRPGKYCEPDCEIAVKLDWIKEMDEQMTAKVCKKCRFYQMAPRKCSLTQGNRAPWDDACKSYDLKGAPQ